MNPEIRHRSGLGANQYYIQVLTIFISVGIVVALAIPPLLKRFHLGGMTAFWFLSCAFFGAYAFLGICFYARAVYDRRLRQAARDGKINGVKQLLDHGAHVNAKDENGYTALTHAATIGSADIAKVLIDHGADVNEIDNKDVTVLMHALENDHFEVVDILRQAGADR